MKGSETMMKEERTANRSRPFRGPFRAWNVWGEKPRAELDDSLCPGLKDCAPTALKIGCSETGDGVLAARRQCFRVTEVGAVGRVN